MSKKRILIVGGVAGGASCAARARRLDETAEIVIFERGPYVSFANCGLPYYVGDVIQDEKKLLLSSPEQFRERFNIDVRVENEVVAIDRAAGEVEVKRLATGQLYRERYDALVLAPGAAPIRPPLPGIELPGVFVLRTVPDSRAIRQWITARRAKSAVVVGAGFIGLEAAENLVRLGMKVTIIEMLDQVMPPLDPEMAEFVYQHLVEKQVEVRLSDAVAGFAQNKDGSLAVSARSGARLDADLVILSVGVRPETGLARAAELAVGESGGIKVDAQMRTSDPRIWAVGDAVESLDIVTGAYAVVPLAGPANRQGRIAADTICGRSARFRGVQATAVCGVLGLTIASTGASEKTLRRRGITEYEKIYTHPENHAGYYPGASRLHLKLLFSPKDGQILGAQAIGGEGAEKRIDVIAMAMQMRATVFDLEEAELCYAPQFGSAKDPVNMAGMAAANVLRGDVQLAPWLGLADSPALIVDVREPKEFEKKHIEGAVNVPLSQLRQRLHELPKDRDIFVYCVVGQRSYNASRILWQNGYRVRNLPGGISTYLGMPRRMLSKSVGTGA
jgi:NADPH-dependent 2,4-dienoyl-CoA reductase/sulfur reductase-like enzyme/rhodanese-related sulfurtransferase